MEGGVNELKCLYNWSDESTVYNAISKLEGLATTWYKSLPSIQFSWDGWKEQLLKTFPPRGDFYQNIIEMTQRNKRGDESYLVYYYEKVALLNKCKIYESDAVSCIIAGISDHTVQAAARAKDYQSHEALLGYLKTCDITQSSTAKVAKPFFSLRIQKKIECRNDLQEHL